MSSPQHSGFLFTNATLIDGTGREPAHNVAVLVEGERIAAILPMAEVSREQLLAHKVVDLNGMTLMPSLIESHFHISYWGVKELADLDLKLPPEECTVYATRNAELCLRMGYTSVCSAGSLHRVDVALKGLIERGVIPGPRMVTSGRDICPTGGMLDWNPSYWKLGMDGLAIFADGVDAVRKATRQVIREDAEVVKVYVTGEGLLRPGSPPEETMMTYDEVAACCDEAHRRNRRVMAHVRGADGVKICVKAGVDIIHHATFSDPEALELLAAHKDRIFVVPALGYTWAAHVKGERCGVPAQVIERARYGEEFEEGCRNMLKLKNAGVRVLPGGDYGFLWCPHGEEAKDLELFVTAIGFTPMETIVAATKWGSQIMQMENEIGTVEIGKYADLLVLDGDPLKDITIFQDRRRIQLVMKGGAVMCNRLNLPQMLAEHHSLQDHLAAVAPGGAAAAGAAAAAAADPDRDDRFAKLLART